MSPAARNELETKLLVGGVIWAFLGIIFEIVTETVAWERWEGTIEYTFMAPVSRPVHLIGMGVFAVLYGIVRAARSSSPSSRSSGSTCRTRTTPPRSRCSRSRRSRSSASG